MLIDYDHHLEKKMKPSVNFCILILIEIKIK